MKTKHDADDAPEPRVEPPYLENARFFAEMFLLLAHRHRHPRQQALLQALIVEFIIPDGCSYGLRPVFARKFRIPTWISPVRMLSEMKLAPEAITDHARPL